MRCMLSSSCHCCHQQHQHHTPSTHAEDTTTRVRSRARPERGEEEEGRRKRRSEATEQRSSGAAAPAALPSWLCSSSRGTAEATNFGSLAPAHDSSRPQRVASMFHRQFSSTSPRTVIRRPLLLSSGSHRNRLFTRMYTCTSGLHYRPRPSTHGRNHIEV